MFKAAFLYFVLVFAAGCVLGPVRVLILAPRVGEVWAVLIEGPFMLAASFVTARLVLARFARGSSGFQRLSIGVAAFAMLILAEVVLAALAGTRPTDFASSWAKPAGAIGLALQGIFALFPLLIRPRAGA